ncbi:MAG TPA: asparaginase [Gemmatimonadaceae bacterium]|nr:asparaginase [Gemmatimonadaceae bacterium]
MGTRDCVKFRRTSVPLLVLMGLAASAPGLAQQTRGKKLPVVWVLAMGGTIAGRGASPTDLSNYKSGTLSGEEIVRSVPQLEQVADVKVEQIVNVPSPNITLANWVTLANRINEIFLKDSSAAGIVVTHGTNTLEETAYFLNLTIKDDRPVVVVGAMRPATAISSDGPLNLLNAVRTAVAPEARGKGVLIVLNEEINGARDATKTDTHRVETFRAPELGFLGYVDDDKVSFYRSSTRRHTVNSEFNVSGIKQLPSVEIIYSYVEPSTTALRPLLCSSVQGIVFAGTGTGDISSFEKAAIRSMLASPATSRPVLVRASRVGNGRVTSIEELDRLGMISADNLNPQKARILLMLALTKTTDAKQIQRMFAEY